MYSPGFHNIILVVFIRKLNNGKAADENGIQAEHFKFANAELATEICSIINQIFEDHRGIAYLALCHG
jgi:hypothetical protein